MKNKWLFTDKMINSFFKKGNKTIKIDKILNSKMSFVNKLRFLIILNLKKAFMVKPGLRIKFKNVYEDCIFEIADNIKYDRNDNLVQLNCILNKLDIITNKNIAPRNIFLSRLEFIEHLESGNFYLIDKNI